MSSARKGLPSELGPGGETQVRELMSPKAARALSVVALALAAATIISLWLEEHRAEETAIQSLSASERRALFERTMSTLRSSCRPAKRPEGLEAFCRAQSKFVLEFPECEGSCRAIAEQLASRPSR